jgi:hypothetical protein
MLKLSRRSTILTLIGALALGVAAPLTVRPVVAQTESARLKAAELSKFLENLGYTPEKVNDSVYRITIERGKFTYRINCSVSGNEKKVWMSTYLSQPAAEKLTSDYLTKVLMANGDTGPAHFYLAKTDDGKTWLKMGYALDNRDLSPKYFREELDWFCERIADKANLWSGG